MAFIKVLKNKAYFKRFQVQKRLTTFSMMIVNSITPWSSVMLITCLLMGVIPDSEGVADLIY